MAILKKNLKIRHLKLNRNKKTSSGFTLMELIVAIGLILILTTAVLGNYIASQKSARDARRKTDLESLKQTLEIYKSSVSPPAYPAVTAGTVENLRPILVPDYVNSNALATDPNADKGYYYYYGRQTSLTYVLCAYLERKSPSYADCPVSPISCGSQDCNYGVTQP